MQPMDTDALARGVHRGMVLAKREGSFTGTMLVLTSAFLLLQLLILSLFGAEAVHRVLAARTGLQLEVLRSASEYQVQEFYTSLRALPIVDDVSYIPREQAYERERAQNPDLVMSLEQLGLENPFPDVFSVSLTGVDAYIAFQQFISDPRWRSVMDSASLTSLPDQAQEMRTFLQITRAVRAGVFTFLCLSIAILVFMLLELITVRIRRRAADLTLESLLGASPTDVIVPIATEMTLHLAVALGIGTLLAVCALFLLPVFASDIVLGSNFHELRWEMMDLVHTRSIWFLLVEVVALPVVALLASALALHHRPLWMAWPRRAR